MKKQPTINKVILTSLVLLFGLTTIVIGNVSQVRAEYNPLQAACERAQGETPEVCNSDVTKPTENPTTKLVGDVSNLVAYAAGFAAVALILVNGVRYALSGGDSNKVNSAKNGIIFALIGGALIIAARSIVALVVTGL